MTSPETVAYKRGRFGTRLPTGRRYTTSHYWLLDDEESGVWRVGFTKFATRMLGDLVEYGFSAKPGDSVAIGQEIGWIEGFKAVSAVYSVVSGEFLGGNPDLERDITLVDTDSYGRGWLYRVRGQPEPASVDVQGYMAVLDTTVDKMLASRRQGEEPPE